ncbi:serine hydrolase domain-containing protein [Streptomyces sp. NPDC046261]|uniref:serine hydrolase domain-containing protein n=1 Tax=Streptomyces sp. NPDC046261 TaxID=3157200 RepID=UPI0033D5546A
MNDSQPRARHGRRAVLRAAAAALAGATVLALAPVASAAPAPSTPVSDGRHQPVDLGADLRALVDKAGATAALAELRDRGRIAWRGAAGKADLTTGERARADGRFRIGSVTKTFAAAVTLQLVAEKKVRLDDPIQRYLPGVVPNGANITVRQLLNHTSGLFDYTDDPEFALDDEASVRRYLAEGRWTTYSARHLVDVANQHDPYFAPGQGWKYSNTNYILVGMLIEKVSGSTWQREVDRRVIRPLRLDDTSMPTTSTRIPGPHAKAYLPLPEGPADVSRINTTVAGAAGAGISSTHDLNRFYAALFGGRLLPAAQLAELKKTVPAPDLGAEYGLGVIRYDTACGPVWGHLGGIAGYSTVMLGNENGSRSLALSNTPYGKDASGGAVFEALLDKALCGSADKPTKGRLPLRGALNILR